MSHKRFPPVHLLFFVIQATLAMLALSFPAAAQALKSDETHDDKFQHWIITESEESWFQWAHPPSDLDPAFVGNTCAGNGLDTCFVGIAGRITDDTVRRFRNFVGTRDGYTVVLNSSGGSLKAGLELGRLIRHGLFSTTIGDFDFMLLEDGTLGQGIEGSGGICNSACAYAFLGGVNRSLGGSKLGFHRFSVGGNNIPGAAGLIAGQLGAAEVVDYLVEMGLEATVFSKASQTPADSLLFLGEEDLQDLNLDTPTGFGEFELETYRDGIVAVSNRMNEITEFDAVQLIGFCLGNQIAFKIVGNRMHNSVAPYDISILAGKKFKWVHDSAGKTVSIYDSDELVWSNGKPLEMDYYVEHPSLRLDNTRTGGTTAMNDSSEDNYDHIVFADVSVSDAILSASRLAISVSLPNSAGGPRAAIRQLNDKDKQNLSAAFRNCIG